MPRFRTEVLSGWGRFPREPCHVFRPERRDELAAVLTGGAQPSYVARGLGRSYGDAALNRDAGVISGVRLNRMIAFDEATGVLECEAGTSLDDIVRVALTRGFFLPVTPGTRFVTVGGAIAANVHGKNHPRAGAFGSCVESLTLMLPSGEVRGCSPTTEPEVFRATLGGMGLTGVVVSARIRLRRVESAWMSVRSRRAGSLQEVMALLGDDAPEHALAWLDGVAGGVRRGRGVVATGDHARSAELGGRKPFPNDFGNPWPAPFPPMAGRLGRRGVGAFNAAVFGLPRGDAARLQPALRFFYPLDSLRGWNRLYGGRGMVQYQCALPTGAAAGGIHALLDEVDAAGMAPVLSVLKRLGPAREGLLSFPLEGFTLAIDLAVRPGVPALLNRLDRRVLEAGGRVYLAKDAVMDAATFRAMYPDADAFQAVRRQLDPEGRISSSLARRIGLVEG
jgi:decaprenylphospho-beta-D-ribofuranose 2-oxidase